MKIMMANDIKNTISNDHEWYFLAKFPLNELLVDMDMRDKPESGLLFQAIRNLSIQPELIDIIETKLAGFAAQAPAKMIQRRFESPTVVRIFYRGNMEMAENVNTSASTCAGGLETASQRVIHQPDPGTKSGWGYFLVERDGLVQPAIVGRGLNRIDLFLYKEGN